MKKILFVIDSLDCAGAEKSLVTLLSLLDFSEYKVDLMLFGHGGVLEDLVPEKVNILPPLKYTHFSNQSLIEAISYAVKKSEYKMFISRMNYSLRIRKGILRNAQKARIFWQCTSNVIDNNPKEYDIAIGYAQGLPTFYVAEKVNAKKKFAWVNVSYRLNQEDREFQNNFYNKMDKVVAVSDSTKEIFLETFPFVKNKLEVIYDINDPKFIMEMAEIGESFNDNFNGTRILTIGRLDNQKGYDIAIDACKKLIEKGLNFRWYALGKGPLQQEIMQKIKDNGLTEHFILLGVKANPYSYIKNSDIYVQTSRFEGFGLAIAEARMLNIPVVTTRFDAVYNQMIDGKNGLVVDMEPDAVCKGILKLLEDNKLRGEILEYLRCEKKGNTEEIEKFYRLIG